MAIEFIEIRSKTNIPCVTVQSSYNLGFNKAATEMFGLHKGSRFKVAKDENGNKYILMTEDKDSVKVIKMGEWYALRNTIFKDLGFTPRQKFQLILIVDLGFNFYKLELI